MRDGFASHLREIEACYRGVDSGKPGYTTVELRIEASGKVSRAIGTGRPETDHCLAELARTFVFPRSNGAVVVAYPFNIDFAGSE